ncbi:hypothetical protein FQN57_003131 [Myotisia sp. PD_48]|nr:hypothetical protein FQN57_003131 [Myotisia sp. PD_48]
MVGLFSLKALPLILTSVITWTSVQSAKLPSTYFTIGPKDDPSVTYNSKNIFLTGGYIVEFDNGRQRSPDFYSALRDVGVEPTKRFDFNHPFFHGSSFVVEEDQDPKDIIEIVQGLRHVKNIWPLKQLSREPGHIVAKGPATIKDQPGKLIRRAEDEKWSTHVMTGVDKLHEAGNIGEGVLVAILDTGVDYKHSDLGGGFGEGYKVAKGYDFVGDNGVTNPKPDNDPYESCGMHGTYIAGIIGANTGTVNFTGVAPGATLGMYRIFDCMLYTSEDIIISAFLKAYDDGADVISLSLGGYSGVNSDPISRVVSKIVGAGTICVASTGELGGPPFQAYSPATGSGVISVASVENIVRPVYRLLAKYSIGKANEKTFEYEPTDLHFPEGPRDLWTWDYKFGSDPMGENCPTFPDITDDIRQNKIVMVPLCISTLLGAALGGVKYLVIHDGGDIIQTVGAPPDVEPLKSLAVVDRLQGDEWQGSILKGEGVILTFPAANKQEWRYREKPNPSIGGSVNVYSSWGPNMQMDPVPYVAAPGGHVLSTLPTKDGRYGVLSGAGAAAPYAAGVAALLKQIKGKVDPATVAAYLGSTATPLKFNDGKASANFLAPAIQQGNGLVNAYAAAHTKTEITPAHLALRAAKKASFKIKNKGEKAVWYTIAHTSSQSVYTIFSNFANRNSIPEMDAAGAKVVITPERVLIPPNSAAEVDIEFTPPSSLAQNRVPIFSGFFTVKPDVGETMSVAYSGSSADLKTIQPFNKGETFLTTAGTFGDRVEAGITFQFPKNSSEAPAELDFPIGLVSLDFYASEIIAELVPDSPIEGFNGRLGIDDPFGPFPPGAVLAIPVFGNLASGEDIPAGNFSLSLRALKFGSRDGDDKSWDKVATTSFGVTILG